MPDCFATMACRTAVLDVYTNQWTAVALVDELTIEGPFVEGGTLPLDSLSWWRLADEDRGVPFELRQELVNPSGEVVAVSQSGTATMDKAVLRARIQGMRPPPGGEGLFGVRFAWRRDGDWTPSGPTWWITFKVAQAPAEE